MGRAGGFCPGGARHHAAHRGLSLTLVVSSLLAAPSAAQEPSVVARVDTTEIHVGDPLGLRVVVDHPLGSTVVWPDSLELASFELLNARLQDPARVDGWLRTVADFTVTGFELGELDLPSIAVLVRDSAGAETTLRTDPFRIGVVSVGLDESGDIRDIKGPVTMPRNWAPPLLWALLVLLFVAAMRWWWTRRGAKEPRAVMAPRAPPRPFGELAYDALDALEASSLLEQGRVKEFHVRLSEIIRSYVEGQLRVPAMELTTTEVVDGLQGAALGSPICDRFRAFLEACDLVKFAKYRPDGDASMALLGNGRALVDATSGGTRRGPTGGDGEGEETPTDSAPDPRTPAEAAP